MDVRLPKLGEGADSGAIVNIMVKVGDTVQKDQPIVELENEKAVASIPSPAAGTVTKVHVKVGDKISVGHPIIALDAAAGGAQTETAEAPKARKPKAAKPEPEEEAEDVPADAGEESEPPAGGPPPAASPSIRRMARELGIDLANVRGTGRGGRIEPQDLRNFVQRLKSRGAAAPAPAAAERIDFSQWGPVATQPFSTLRQTVAKRMVGSWNAIPHVTQFDEAELTRLLALKKQYDPAYEKAGGRLTITALLLKAVVATLKAHDKFNSSLDEAAQQLVFKQYYHLGIAVDTEAGLMVPVLRDVDKKPLAQLAKELGELAEKTRARKVTVEEMRGGTFTISNQGGIGGGHFTPIINKPEVAILGVAKSVVKPVVRDGKIEARAMLPVALSYDHRVIDGGDAARFIVDLVKNIEEFPERDVKLS